MKEITQKANSGWLWVVGVTGRFFPLLYFPTLGLGNPSHPTMCTCWTQCLHGDSTCWGGRGGMRRQTWNPTRTAQVCRKKATSSIPLPNPDSPRLKSHFHTVHCSQFQGQSTPSSIELIQFKTITRVCMHSKSRLKSLKTEKKVSYF